MATKKSKNILVGSIVLISAVVTGILLLKSKDSTSNDSSGNTNGGSGTGTGSGTGITNEQAKVIADLLHEDMRFRFSDEETPFNRLQELTLEDFKKVIVQFGERCYNPIFGDDSGCIFLPDLNLVTWLKSELEDSQLELLRLKFPNIL